MLTKLSLLFFLLSFFHAAVVEALLPDHLNTNAKRFAAGLPPLAPIRKRASPADTAMKTRHSATPKRCEIGVSVLHGERLGYISRNLKDGHFTLSKQGDTFFTYIHFHGTTKKVNLMDSNKPGYYLAGIIKPGATLGPYSDDLAKIGDSYPTKPGDEPHSDTKPTLPGESETAIWTYSASTGRISAQWVNGGYSYGPKTVPAYLFYDKSSDTLYLSGAKEHASFLRVEFHLDCP